MNKKEWFGLGLVGIVMTGLVSIWRSIKIGRTLTLWGMAIFLFWFGARFSDLVFTKFINRWEVRKESDNILKHLEELKKRIKSNGENLDKAGELIEERVALAVNDELDRFRSRIDGIEKNLKLIENNAELMLEEERAAFKKRIYELNEKLMVNNDNINLKSIRLESEVVINGMNLFKNEEKGKYEKILKDMGFEVSNMVQVVRKYQMGGYSIASTEAVVFWGGDNQ